MAQTGHAERLRAIELLKAQQAARQLSEDAQRAESAARRRRAPRGQPDTQSNRDSRAQFTKDAEGMQIKAQQAQAQVSEFKTNPNNYTNEQISDYSQRAVISEATKKRQRQSRSRAASSVMAREGNNQIRESQSTELKRLGGSGVLVSGNQGPTKTSETLGTDSRVRARQVKGKAPLNQPWEKGFTNETRAYGYSTTGSAEVERKEQIKMYEQQEKLNTMGLSVNINELNKDGVSTIYQTPLQFDTSLKETPKRYSVGDRTFKDRQTAEKFIERTAKNYDGSYIGYGSDGKPIQGAVKPTSYIGYSPDGKPIQGAVKPSEEEESVIAPYGSLSYVLKEEAIKKQIDSPHQYLVDAYEGIDKWSRETRGKSGTLLSTAYDTFVLGGVESAGKLFFGTAIELHNLSTQTIRPYMLNEIAPGVKPLEITNERSGILAIPYNFNENRWKSHAEYSEGLLNHTKTYGVQSTVSGIVGEYYIGGKGLVSGGKKVIKGLSPLKIGKEVIAAPQSPQKPGGGAIYKTGVQVQVPPIISQIKNRISTGQTMTQDGRVYKNVKGNPYGNPGKISYAIGQGVDRLRNIKSPIKTPYVIGQAAKNVKADLQYAKFLIKQQANKIPIPKTPQSVKDVGIKIRLAGQDLSTKGSLLQRQAKFKIGSQFDRDSRLGVLAEKTRTNVRPLTNNLNDIKYRTQIGIGNVSEKASIIKRKSILGISRFVDDQQRISPVLSQGSGAGFPNLYSPLKAPKSFGAIKKGAIKIGTDVKQGAIKIGGEVKKPILYTKYKTQLGIQDLKTKGQIIKLGIAKQDPLNPIRQVGETIGVKGKKIKTKIGTELSATKKGIFNVLPEEYSSAKPKYIVDNKSKNALRNQLRTDPQIPDPRDFGKQGALPGFLGKGQLKNIISDVGRKVGINPRKDFNIPTPKSKQNFVGPKQLVNVERKTLGNPRKDPMIKQQRNKRFGPNKPFNESERKLGGVPLKFKPNAVEILKQSEKTKKIERFKLGYKDQPTELMGKIPKAKTITSSPKAKIGSNKFDDLFDELEYVNKKIRQNRDRATVSSVRRTNLGKGKLDAVGSGFTKEKQTATHNELLKQRKSIQNKLDNIDSDNIKSVSAKDFDNPIIKTAKINPRQGAPKGYIGKGRLDDIVKSAQATAKPKLGIATDVKRIINRKESGIDKLALKKRRAERKDLDGERSPSSTGGDIVSSKTKNQSMAPLEQIEPPKLRKKASPDSPTPQNIDGSSGTDWTGTVTTGRLVLPPRPLTERKKRKLPTIRNPPAYSDYGYVTENVTVTKVADKSGVKLSTNITPRQSAKIVPRMATRTSPRLATRITPAIAQKQPQALKQPQKFKQAPPEKAKPKLKASTAFKFKPVQRVRQIEIPRKPPRLVGATLPPIIFNKKSSKPKGKKNKQNDFLGNSKLDSLEGLFRRNEIIYGDRKISKQIKKDRKAKFGNGVKIF